MNDSIKLQKIRTKIEASKGEFAKALSGLNIGVDRFIRLCFSAINQTPALINCEPASFIQAALISAQLGLEPNTPLGHAYIIPYGNKAQFQIGYQGLLELLYRSDKIKWCFASIVYESEEFSIEYGSNPNVKHIPILDDDKRGAIRGAYAVAELTNGAKISIYMSKNEISKIQARSKSPRSPAWTQDWEMMAKKTVLKRLIKYLPKSVEANLASEIDSRFDVGKEIKFVEGAFEEIPEPEPQKSDEEKIIIAVEEGMKLTDEKSKKS